MLLRRSTRITLPQAASRSRCGPAILIWCASRVRPASGPESTPLGNEPPVPPERESAANSLLPLCPTSPQVGINVGCR